MPGRFYAEEQGTVTAALSELGLSRLKFRFEPQGSQIIEGESLKPVIEKQHSQVVNSNPPIGANSLR